MSTVTNISSRKATARQREMQLKVALKELQASKDLCEQLLRERDDSEVELQKILDKNTAMKNELAEFQVKLTDSEDQVDYLQRKVDSFTQCASTHEVALKQITNLQEELGAAYEDLNLYRRERERYDARILQNLYQELVGSDSNDSNKLVFFNSSNKLKKYVKINRYIRRTQKLINSKACIKNYGKLKLELSVMKNRVQQCNLELETQELNSQKVHAELNRLKDKLEATTSLYISTQKEYKEHVQAFTKLLEESKENEERFNSLINSNFCNCSHIPPTAVVQQDMVLSTSSATVPVITEQPHELSSSKTIIYSDQIGSGMGSMLSKKLTQNVINYCYHNASVDHICDLMLKGRYDDSTNLVILLGNSLNVDKSAIDKLMSTLTIIEKTGIGKIIICALPYSQSMTYHYNNKIAHLNSLIYHAICFNNKYHFFDINKFIKRFTLTSEKIFLPKKYFLSLVDLLAFNIEPNRCNSSTSRPHQVDKVIKALN